MHIVCTVDAYWYMYKNCTLYNVQCTIFAFVRLFAPYKTKQLCVVSLVI
jgi:hypothetical protein